MGFKVFDRVSESSTSTGTGNFTLAGAVTGFRTFASVLSNADTTSYTIDGGTGEWETGIGTYNSSGTTLTRTTVIASSNGGSAVNFSSGTKTVSMVPITRQVVLLWETYTPTFTGFGTVPAESSWSRRVGDSLHLQVKWQAGTPTAVEARISLPSGLTVSSTKIPGIRSVGSMTTNGTTTDNYFPLALGGDAYITIGRQSASVGGLTARNGNDLMGTNIISSLTAEIPITGW